MALTILDFPRDLHHKLKAKAFEIDEHLGSMVTQILREWLTEHPLRWHEYIEDKTKEDKNDPRNSTTTI